jgi:hypothetical protein
MHLNADLHELARLHLIFLLPLLLWTRQALRCANEAGWSTLFFVLGGSIRFTYIWGCLSLWLILAFVQSTQFGDASWLIAFAVRAMANGGAASADALPPVPETSSEWKGGVKRRFAAAKHELPMMLVIAGLHQAHQQHQFANLHLALWNQTKVKSSGTSS